MFIARSEYDRGINTFSPEGRLFQVEYSLEAIKLGSTAIGVATGEGVILGVEKRVTSTLLETSGVEKIFEIDRHIGCAMSGLQADARSMIEHARVESQNHTFHYSEPLRVESCTQAICDLALRFGEGADGEESIMSRPFGVALLIAGVDEDGPQLFHAEPSGTFYRYDAKAIGSGSEGAQAELQNEFHKSLTLQEAETMVLKTLKQVMEEKLDSKNVQLASVTREKGFRIYSDEEMSEVVKWNNANQSQQPRITFSNGGFGGLSTRSGKKPVIAAVNGICFGGGCEMIINCDIVLASSSASIGLPEVKRGVIALAGALPRLVRTVGRQRAMEMALTGRTLNAEEAKEWGLVNKVVEGHKLLDEAIRWAEEIAGNSPDSVIVSREGVKMGWNGSGAQEGTEILRNEWYSRMDGGENMREGVAAFVEKRKPIWVDSKL
ncbi:proteasome component pup2 [Xylographa trunciseda]|nr:proteasome component pup2 [Xylographa trunciseda]